ncbi:hypothetical protein D3C80_1700210 [compost metagenome]
MVNIIFTQCNREVSVRIIIFACSFQGVFSVHVAPFLINQADYAATCDFCLVLVFLLYKSVLVKQAFIVHMVQPTEIFFFFSTLIVQLSFISLWINIVFTIIRSTRSNKRRVSNRNHNSPVIRTQGQRNRWLSICCWMLRIIFLQYVFKIL